MMTETDVRAWEYQRHYHLNFWQAYALARATLGGERRLAAMQLPDEETLPAVLVLAIITLIALTLLVSFAIVTSIPNL